MRLRAGAAVAAAVLVAGCGGGGAAAVRSPGVHHAAAPARAVDHAPLRIPADAPARTVRVPILMYHRVHVYATEYTKSLLGLTVEPDRFAAEIGALVRHGYHSITIRQLFGALFRGTPLPPRPVLLTFDDGYADGVKRILPVLQRAHMTAVFYVITDRFHEPGFLTRREIRRLDRAGMDIGAHTRHHVDLPGLPASELDSEIAGSRRDLERVVGHPIDSFAYPAGRYDASVVAAVRRAGFALAVTTNPGTVESSREPLLMPRVRVSRDTTVAELLACMASPSGCGGATGE